MIYSVIWALAFSQGRTISHLWIFLISNRGELTPYSAEYSAKYNLNISVPYTTYENSDVTQTAINATDRGDVRPI